MIVQIYGDIAYQERAHSKVNVPRLVETSASGLITFYLQLHDSHILQYPEGEMHVQMSKYQIIFAVAEFKRIIAHLED